MAVEDALSLVEFLKEPSVLGLLAAAAATRNLLEKLTPNGRFIEQRDEMHREWVAATAGHLADFEQRFDEHEREEYRRRTVDDEFVAVLANYFRAAHEEPLRERRRMLEFASATLANLSLTIGELARIQRALRELDPGDLIALHRVSLIPTRQPGRHPKFGLLPTADHLRYEFWHQSNAEALESSGCIVVRVGGGGDSVAFPEVRLSALGQTVRRAMLPYIRAIDPHVTMVPGHEVTDDFRTREQAEELIGSLPGMRHVLQLARACGKIQYSGASVYLGASHDARASLDFNVPEEQANRLGRVTRSLELLEADARNRLLVSHIGVPGDGKVSIQVWGPHDVMRLLAYDFDAIWA